MKKKIIPWVNFCIVFLYQVLFVIVIFNEGEYSDIIGLTVMEAVIYVIVIPIISFFYSKRLLIEIEDNTKKIQFIIYHSLVLTLAYVAPYYTEGLRLLFGLPRVFAWFFLWGLLGIFSKKKL